MAQAVDANCRLLLVRLQSPDGSPLDFLIAPVRGVRDKNGKLKVFTSSRYREQFSVKVLAGGISLGTNSRHRMTRKRWMKFGKV